MSNYLQKMVLVGIKEILFLKGLIFLGYNKSTGNVTSDGQSIQPFARTAGSKSPGQAAQHYSVIPADYTRDT